MTNKDKEVFNAILKLISNMQVQIDLLVDNLIVETKDELKIYNDKIVEIEKDTYQQMCELMESNTIPFMGIA
tara:strand:- start:21 stop:236 length:216 start_codon:yes stop_codon:yes gene_type:complete